MTLEIPFESPNRITLPNRSPASRYFRLAGLHYSIQNFVNFWKALKCQIKNLKVISTVSTNRITLPIRSPASRYFRLAGLHYSIQNFVNFWKALKYQIKNLNVISISNSSRSSRHDWKTRLWMSVSSKVGRKYFGMTFLWDYEYFSRWANYKR